MRHTRVSLLLSALLAGCGTVSSLEPLSVASDLVFEPALVGAWTDDSAELHLVITPSEQSGYLIALAESDGKTGRFVAQLTRLNGRLVLDVTPEPLGAHVSDLYRDLLRPLHTFFFIEIRDAQLLVSIPHADSVRNYLRADPAAPAYTDNSDGLLLTAPTVELRAFLAAMSLRAGVIDSVINLRRP